MKNQLVTRWQAELLYRSGFAEFCSNRYVGDEVFAGSIHRDDPQPHVLRCPTIEQACAFLCPGGDGLVHAFINERERP